MTYAVDLFIVGYLAFIALRQQWAMFAPEPTAQSTRLHVVIRLASGDAIRWDPPRFTASRCAAMRGFRRRLYELMLTAPEASAARQLLAARLVRTYTSSDLAIDAVFVCTRTTVAVPWSPEPPPPVEEIVEIVSVTADHASAAGVC